jgi:hypothetical protein
MTFRGQNRYSHEIFLLLKSDIFWVVTSYGPVEVHQCLGGTHCLHFRGWRVCQPHSHPEAGRKENQHRWASNRLQRPTSQKIGLFIVTTMRISNPTFLLFEGHLKKVLQVFLHNSVYPHAVFTFLSCGLSVELDNQHINPCLAKRKEEAILSTYYTPEQ